MARRALISIILACSTVGLGYAAFGQRVARAPAFTCTKRMSVNDWRLLLDGVKTSNPDMAERLDSDAEFRKTQAENVRQLFAFACQAVKDGTLKDPINKAEIENIQAEVTAVTFDKLVNKPASAAPFSTISDARVLGFYKIPANNAGFENFLKAKVELLKRSNPNLADREVTAEERAQARETFAKISLTGSDIRQRRFHKITPDFLARTALQVRLQQAQFLSRIFSEKLAAASGISDAEIAAYIASHPEFDSSKKRAEAQQILERARAGEDFARLADENTDDPGNGGPDGKAKQGGIYRAVPRGMMIAVFEAAALALEPGQVAPQLVETEYGFHIIKLESKGSAPDSTYDVRHILIATTVKDPANPNAAGVSVRDLVRNTLETEKEALFIAKVVADNPIDIAPVPFGDELAAKPAPKQRRARRK